MALLEQLEFEEGTRLHAYPDSRGFTTIGTGHNLSAQPNFRGQKIPRTITKEYNDALLLSDIEETERELEHEWPPVCRLDPVRRDTCIAMAFQLGVDTFMEFKHMRDALTSGRWADATAHALNSAWARETPARAKRVASQFQSGEYYEVPK